MPRYESAGAGVWVRRWWRALVSEVVATALLVWLGLAAGMPLEDRAPPPLAHVAAAFGFVAVGCCVAFGATSGAHMNPAVSLAAALTGKLAWPLFAAYSLAQTLGAVLGFAALQATLPVAQGAGVTLPANEVGSVAACALEAALTGLLALACCGVWSAPADHRDPAVPIKLGLLIAGLVYSGGGASGASLNPARSFAPALLHRHWDQHWVYWVGPLGGAAIGALLHRWVLSAPAPRLSESSAAETVPEAVPLEDKV